MVIAITSISVSFSSCGVDEPDAPQKEEPDPKPNNPGNSQDDSQDEEVPGNEILGTWYYLSPDKALKATVIFTSEKAPNYSTFGSRVCYISIESQLPYNVEDYDNSWTYSDSKWKITRFSIIPVTHGATIPKVFDNELWMDLGFINHTQRIKFTRNDPGNSVKPNGLQVAPDGIFGKYLWKGSFGSHNITIQFKESGKFHETSDSNVGVIGIDGSYKHVKENDCEGGYMDGYFHYDCTGILCSVLGCSTVVVIKQSDKKLMIYNPFTPDRTYFLTRD